MGIPISVSYENSFRAGGGAKNMSYTLTLLNALVFPINNLITNVNILTSTNSINYKKIY